MLYLLRIFLVILLIVLLVRTFSRSLDSKAPETNRSGRKKDDDRERKISEKVGEYVDYEEVEK